MNKSQEQRRRVPGTWETTGESIDLGDGRWGYSDLVRTSGDRWGWLAEGGALGHVEGTARTMGEARERIEQVLGMQPLAVTTSKAVAAYAKKVRR